MFVDKECVDDDDEYEDVNIDDDDDVILRPPLDNHRVEGLSQFLAECSVNW